MKLRGSPWRKLKIKDAPINREKITQEWRVRSITLSQEDNLLKKELVSLRNQITSLQTKKASGIFSPIKGNVVFTRAQTAVMSEHRFFVLRQMKRNRS
ncbi:hypothetical protein V2V90_00120 [Agrobacterium leguminum]|uniref:hypothetical protein n=1 Tax=Agrobacterium leguminum TaxID=2792015 RepID=UPI0030D33E7D